MVYILLGAGFEETEAIAPLDLLRRAGIDVMTVGINGKHITGSHNITVEADIALNAMDLSNIEMIVLPGGLGGVVSLKACPEALDAVRFCWKTNKFIAAICAAPTILAELGILDGKKATCYPGQEIHMQSAVMQENQAVVVDGNIITGTSAGTAIPFGLALITALKGNEIAQAILKQIVVR